jgi:CheY-like chemotaxis protein
MQMQNLRLLRDEQPAPEHPLVLLLADDDAGIRALVGTWVRGGDVALEVIEAEDGSEAIQLGLQHRPQLALLDIDMPRVGGIEAAVVLRGLLPQLSLALYSGDARVHRDRAHDLGLPLFDKSDLDPATRWVSAQAAASLSGAPTHRQPQKVDLVCAGCGFGICRSVPPRQCPMCHGAGSWLRKPRRPIVELA